MGHHLKHTQKNVAFVKIPYILILVQICLAYPIMYTTNTIFYNLALSHFSIYGQITSCKKLRKSTE